MTDRKMVLQLAQLTQLTLDVKLANLRQAAKMRQHSLDLLAQLDAPIAVTDLPLLAQDQAELRYRNWADARRAEINVLLARQTASMLLARNEAGLAFGKNQALDGLQKKML